MTKKPRILIVEDIPKWVQTYRRILPDEENKIIDVAQNLPQARKLLHNHIFDLVLLDLRLTDWDMADFRGMELLPDLDTAKAAYGTQVIIITAHGTIEIVREAFKGHEISDFFEKKNLATEVDRFAKAIGDGIEKAQRLREDDPTNSETE